MKENDLEREEKTGGFRVKDRRRFDSDGNERPDSGPAVSVESRNGGTPPPEKESVRVEATKEQEIPKHPQREERGPKEEPPVSFSSLIMSLAHQALLHLGLTESVRGGTRQVDKQAAKETIDILSMLEIKTRGNLDEEEERMIQEILHELRMTYVRIGK